MSNPTPTDPTGSPSPSPTGSEDSTDYPKKVSTPTELEQTETKKPESTKELSPVKSVSGESSSESKTLPDLTESSSPSFELLYWNDPKDTGIIVGVILAVYYCLVWREHSFLTLASFVLALNLVAVGVHTLLKLTPLRPYVKPDATLPNSMDLLELLGSSGLFMAFKGLFLATIIYVRLAVTASLQMNSIADFTRMLSLTYGVYLIGSWFTPLTLSFLCFVCAFSVPKVYIMKQKVIDAKILEFKTKFNSKYEEVVKGSDKAERFINFVTNSKSIEKKD